MSHDHNDAIASALALWRQDSSELVDATGLPPATVDHAIATGDPSPFLLSDDLALRFHAVLCVRAMEAKRTLERASTAAETVLRRFLVDE